jgi:multiple sugar transport system permease protein
MKIVRPRRFTLYTLLILGAVANLLPLLWMFGASFMTSGEANSLSIHLIPDHPTLEQYVTLFTRMNLARSFFNSAFITVMATLGSVCINAMAGYAFAKLHFGGRNWIFRALTTALIVPAQVGMLPLFLLLREMGLVNTYTGALIPYLASVFGIFLIRQYTLGVPDDMLDAARVDGASEFRIFVQIVLPVIKPILVTLATFTFLSSWNDFMWPLIILSDSAKYTLPVALANLVGEHALDTELMMAGSVLTVLPALVVFLVFQRSYVRGIMAGSVKG